MIRRVPAILLAFILLCGQAAWAGDLSLKEELKIGREAYQEVIAQIPMVNDAPTIEYIRDLGKRLATQVPDSPFPFHFYVANESDMNAFAIPGGWIFIYRGMITAMDSEGELAGVMAHEMSHVYYRHIAGRMKRGSVVNAATLAGMIAGMLLGGLSGSPELGQAVALGSMAGGTTKQLAFSREDEEQADYGGYKIITGLGYPPQEMERSFKRIYRQQQYTIGTSIPTYLLTHPTSDERMERLQNLVRRHKPKLVPYDNKRFLRIRTRLIAMYEAEDKAGRTFERESRMKPGDPLPIYGMALLEMRRSHFDRALALLKRLGEKWPGDAGVRRATGICLLRLGQYGKAQPLLQKVLANDPGDVAARLALGRCYMNTGELGMAKENFERALAKDKDNDEAMYELGMVMGKMGKTGEASLYLGLAFKARRNMRAARYHLERAEKALAGKPDLQAKAKTALEDIKGAEEKAKKRPASQEFFSLEGSDKPRGPWGN